jgi:hypothetical protein
MEPQLHFVLGMLQYLYYLLGDDHSTNGICTSSIDAR